MMCVKLYLRCPKPISLQTSVLFQFCPNPGFSVHILHRPIPFCPKPGYKLFLSYSKPVLNQAEPILSFSKPAMNSFRPVLSVFKPVQSSCKPALSSFKISLSSHPTLSYHQSKPILRWSLSLIYSGTKPVGRI